MRATGGRTCAVKLIVKTSAAKSMKYFIVVFVAHLQGSIGVSVYFSVPLPV